jgi:DNA-binding transcriptional LysR family regulator
MTGTVSGAAEMLGYTPSAISQQLAALQKETGVRLLERNGRGITLTAAAQTLVEHANTIFAQLERAEAELRAHDDRLAGAMRIASFATALQTFVGTAVNRLAARAPDVQLRIEEAEPEVALPALTQRLMDIVIGYEYDVLATPQAAGVSVTDLMFDPLVLLGVAHDDADPVRLDALADRGWLLPPPLKTCGRAIRRACETVGFLPESVATSTSVTAIAELAVQGLGVALVPLLALDPATAASARRTDPQFHRRIFLAVRDGGQENPVVATAVDEVMQAAARWERSWPAFQAPTRSGKAVEPMPLAAGGDLHAYLAHYSARP